MKLKDTLKRGLSLLLTASMLLCEAPAVLADDDVSDSDSGTAYFDFEATEYEADENSGELSITIIRHGENTCASDVSFKAADYLSEYGQDYEILDDSGNPLERVEGEKPDPSEFVQDSSDSIINDEDEASEADADEAADTSDDDVTDSTGDDNAAMLTEEAAAADDTAALSEETAPVSEDKQRVSTGSSLLDAAYSYLNVPEEVDAEATEAAVSDVLSDLYSYFATAQGAAGTVHFESGETQKTITVRLLDNENADGSRLFMLALMGSSAENTTIAANATTYVSIADDEDYDTPYVELAETSVDLTELAPSATVTVRRTTGTQYFTTVYVSTVTDTAPDGSYEAFEGDSVSFVPGETEKQVTVTATDFSDGGSFGVRLEAENVEIGNYYTTVNILVSDASDASADADDDTAGLSETTPYYLGKATTGGEGCQVDGGWKSVVTGSDSANYAYFHQYSLATYSPGSAFPGELCLKQTDSKQYSMLVSKETRNYTGIKNITYKLWVGGEGSKFTTWFELGNDQNYGYNVKSNYVTGKTDWSTRTLDTSSLNSNLYLRFITRSNTWGNHNPEARINYIAWNYAAYTFDCQNSAENFNRKIYDFTDTKSALLTYDTFYDGETSTVYNPGPVVIRNADTDVTGYYANNSASITISSTNEAKNAERGITLKGVYFANSSKDKNSMIDQNGKYTTSGVYYVAATNGVVTVTPDQDFTLTLKNRGVLSWTNQDETIKIFPVYEQSTVDVSFEPSDPYETESSMDAQRQGSCFTHIYEACQQGLVTRTPVYDDQYSSSNTISHYVYTISVPKGSVIRAQVQPASNRIPQGITWSYNDSRSTGCTYYKQGETSFSTQKVSGDEITATDYTRADIVADAAITLTPKTGEQTFYIAYYPGSKKPVEDLTGAVSDVTDSSTGAVSTGSDGSMYLEDAAIGKAYTLTALPPEGYYTHWILMTGDTNHDGSINSSDSANSRNNRNNSENSFYVFGSTLNVTLDTDDTIYYYEFLPINNNTTRLKSGSVQRSSTTFYELANNISNSATEPVVGAYVSLGDAIVQTDADGYYEATLHMGLSAGQISMSIADGNFTAFSMTAIEENKTLILPALERFNADSVSVAYSSTSSAIAGQMISVEDDTLTIKLSASSNSTITPANARFLIYDSNGNLKISCADDSSYTISTNRSERKLSVTFSFNPKKDISTGDMLYVQFADQNGLWYTPIDVGYTFYSPLSLTEFVLPAIGSDTLESAVKSSVVTDILGDGQSDFLFGKVPALDVTTGLFSTESISDRDQDLYKNWVVASYSYGWSKTFSGSKSWDSKTKYNEALKAYKEKLKQKAAADSSSGSSSDSSSDSSSGGKSGSEGSSAADTSAVSLLAANSRDDGGVKTETDNSDSDNSGSGIASPDDSDSDKSDSDKSDSGSSDSDSELKAPDKSKYNTKGSFSWSITPKVGFNLTLTNRNGKNYFEDLLFYAEVTGKVAANEEVKLPIGMSIIVGGSLTADATVIYRMYTDYTGTDYINGAVAYNASEFGLFKDFNNNVRREGYIFLNPEIGITLDVKYGIIDVGGSAQFKFDMDFQFTEANTYAYGDLTIDLGWHINLVGFTVYSKTYTALTKKLFSSNTDGHIELDVNNASGLLSLADSADDADSDEEVLQLDTPVSRDYLENRSDWYGDAVELLDDDDTGTTEWTLRNGSAGEADVQLTKINDDGDLLMVYVDDDTSRSDVNKRAVYYTIRHNSTWSEPVLLDNDGTLDDYPDVTNLENGKILVTWSSAGQVFGDDATVLDALKSLNIKAAFFDTETETFGEITQLTKTTDEDYTADVLPHAAYDSESDRLILYYTKTEYDELNELTDISTAYSVTAYLFYENGAWCNDGSVYTDEELSSQTTTAAKNRYREQWYGQRFLDLRTDSSATSLPRVVDTDAISYNSLALYAWTVDWDDNLETTDDRDVFVQIYNFESGSFTHIIRLTADSGAYTSPQFVRSNDSTYLFYGQKADDEDDGTICYLNISDIVKNDKLVKVTNGSISYYMTQYTSEPIYAVNEDGSQGDLIAEAETKASEPETATICNNISDYRVVTDESGNIYLIWTDTVNDSRQVLASVYNGIPSDASEVENDDNVVSIWSDPVTLTNASKNAYYSNIGAAVIDGTIYIGGNRGSYDDEAVSDLVLIAHKPYTEIEVESVALDNSCPLPGTTIDAIATIHNNGLLMESDPVTVTFQKDGETFATETATLVPGGSYAYVTAAVTLPDDLEGVTLRAQIDNGSKADFSLTPEASITISDESIVWEEDAAGSETPYLYTAVLTNGGNKASEPVTLTLTRDGEAVVSNRTPSLEVGESRTVTFKFALPDSAFEITSDGIGSAELDVTAVTGDETIYDDTASVTRQFDEVACTLLSQLDDIQMKDTYTVQSGDTLQISPTFTGVEDGSLRVHWLTTSDSTIAYTDGSSIYADQIGTATLTGIVVPTTATSSINADGSEDASDWSAEIPSNQLRTVTVQVQVTASHALSFVDVADSSAYYYNAVYWAVDQQVTAGTDSTHFSPDESCTRAQAVAFLWRLAGSPEPEAASSFVDVSASSYYAKAVAWAQEQGITAGVDSTHFAPDETTTRAQFVSFLYRYAHGAADASTANPFTDVKTGAYYKDAVLWAVKNGITSGTSATTFSPEDSCTRAQAVAFLWRCAKNQ